MLVKQVEPLTPAQKAERLGLKSSYFRASQMNQQAQQAIESVKRKDRPRLKLSDWQKEEYFRSDAMYQLFDCPDTVSRRDVDTLSLEEFTREYEHKNRPAVIRGCAQNWPAINNWQLETLAQKYGSVSFKVGEDEDGGKLKLTFSQYLQYLVYNTDDSPLYLFQNGLADKPETHSLIEDYFIPTYFQDDLFKLAGQKKRPPHRWFIIGPERSGSTIHIDPLMTSAWNTSVQGHKRWVLFGSKVPKSIAKGKQFRSKDYQDEAINYFVEILPKIREKYSREELQMVEFIQYPGQTVFVPGGLWHSVINLNDTIAITQNVMTRFGFDQVWRATRTERIKFASSFLQKLKQQDIQLYNRAQTINLEDKYQMGEKYCKQSVSLSFTPSSSSSSEESSSKQASFSDSSHEDQVKRVSQRLSQLECRSRSLSRSRNKPKETSFSLGKRPLWQPKLPTPSSP